MPCGCRAAADDDVVVVGRSQTRGPVELTAAELRDAVARCRAGLAAARRGRGDRVAAYLPNVPEAIVAFLATASLGAIWSSCAPEFGVRAVIDRFAQIEPRVLLAIDGYRYGDKAIDRRAELARSAPPCRRSSRPSCSRTSTRTRRPRSRARSPGPSSSPRPARSTFEPVPFDHPLYILYSSGTTGPAQADRPRPRRDPPRAPQGARAAHGPRAGRPVPVVHDDRLDDVELPRLGARGRVDGRDVRRQPGWPDLASCGAWRRETARPTSARARRS